MLAHTYYFNLHMQFFFSLEDNVDDQNILDSIHNCTYLSVAVLHNIQRCETLIFIAVKRTPQDYNNEFAILIRLNIALNK